MLPELLFFATLLAPDLMPRIGLAGRYAAWAPEKAQAQAEAGADGPAAAAFEHPLSRAVFFLSFKQRGGIRSARPAAASSTKLDASTVVEGDEETGGGGGSDGSIKPVA